MSIPIEFNCKGAGAYGMFVDHDQLIILLNKLPEDKLTFFLEKTTITKIDLLNFINSKPNYGAKILFERDAFEEEVKNLNLVLDAFETTTTNTPPKKIRQTTLLPEGTIHTFEIKSTKLLHFIGTYEDLNGVEITDGAETYEAYFILQKPLLPLTRINFPISDWTEFNAFFMDYIVKPLLAELEILHKNGFYHQDIKPQNIMISEDKKATLIDFGLMRHIDKDGYAGTRSYMSPGYLKEIAGVNRMPMRSFNYSTFFKMRSVYSYKNTFLSRYRLNDIKKKNRKAYILAKNDLFAVGFTLQQLYNPLIPFIPEIDIEVKRVINPVENNCPKDKLNDYIKIVNDSRNLCYPDWKIGKEDNFPKKKLTKEEICDFVMSGFATGGIQLGGSKIKKDKRHVCGRLRTVYKIKGQGNTLFVRIKGKEMKLKEAMKMK